MQNFFAQPHPTPNLPTIWEKLENVEKDIKRLENEKGKKAELSEKLEQEKTEERSFKEQLEQAIRDLGIFQDAQTPVIAVRIRDFIS